MNSNEVKRNYLKLHISKIPVWSSKAIINNLMVRRQFFNESAVPNPVRAEVNIPKHPAACCRDRNVSLSP
jgi:hypothetical protein